MKSVDRAVPASYYIYYRVAPGKTPAAAGTIHQLLAAVREATGIEGRLLKRRGEPHLWMEIYENVADEARFESQLAAAVSRLGVADLLQAGTTRHIECFDGMPG